MGEKKYSPITDLPKSWRIIPLRYACEMNPESVNRDEQKEMEIEYIDISSVNSRGEIAQPDKYSLQEAPSRAQRIVCHGDTIVSTVRTYLKAIAHIEDPPENTIVSTGFCVLRPSDALYPPFLSYVLQADPFIEWIVANSEGVSYPAIKPSRLGDLRIPTPPTSVQESICAYLDERVDNIDEMIDQLEDLESQLDLKMDAEVTNTIQTGVGTMSLVSSDTDWLGKIPKHWETTKLMYLTKDGTPVYGILKPGPDVSDGVPYIESGHITNRDLSKEKLPKTRQDISSEYQRTILSAGEIVYAIRGSYGNAEIVPDELAGANLSRDAARISPIGSVDSGWLCWALKSDTSQQQFDVNATGSAVKGVNIQDLKRLVLPLPPKDEQREIADYLNQLDSKVESVRARINQSIDLLKEKRRSLITAAVTGQIDVKDTPDVNQELTT